MHHKFEESLSLEHSVLYQMSDVFVLKVCFPILLQKHAVKGTCLLANFPTALQKYVTKGV